MALVKLRLTPIHPEATQQLRRSPDGSRFIGFEIGSPATIDPLPTATRYFRGASPQRYADGHEYKLVVCFLLNIWLPYVIALLSYFYLVKGSMANFRRKKNPHIAGWLVVVVLLS